jgi:hypothetical protein
MRSKLPTPPEEELLEEELLDEELLEEDEELLDEEDELLDEVPPEEEELLVPLSPLPDEPPPELPPPHAARIIASSPAKHIVLFTFEFPCRSTINESKPAYLNVYYAKYMTTYPAFLCHVQMNMAEMWRNANGVTNSLC